MADDRLPALIVPFGPSVKLALHIHELTMQGRQVETLTAADAAEPMLHVLGDEQTRRSIRLARMYALVALGRLQEALAVGEDLIATATGPRSTDAKILADTGEVLLRMGRIDDGLQHLARALVILETAPRGSVRYVSAMYSLCDAAKVAELFELADESMIVADGVFGFSDQYRSAADQQRAELRLEWGLRLEQVGQLTEANRLYTTSVELLERWRDRGGPLTTALLALGLAKTGRAKESLDIIHDMLMPARQAGEIHEARLLHLAHGLLLRDAGDLRGARREFLAADELSVMPSQRLIYRFELAVLATLEFPGEQARSVLAALRDQLDMLWRLRLDRRTMLRQAHRRVELEAARRTADLAATSDALTGLANRRVFDRRIASVTGALLLIDVDRFKLINDAFSHGVGDAVLREIAGVLRAHCRHDEVAIRFGGDEFALFLTAGELESRQVAERIRQVILARDWSTIAPGLHVTLSMGLATTRLGETGNDLYDRADANLYAAKRAGRNRLAAA